MGYGLIKRRYDNYVVFKSSKEISPGMHELLFYEFKDYAGNQLHQYRVNFEVPVDKEAPYVENVEVVDCRKLNVIFNEDVEDVGEFMVNQVPVQPQMVSVKDNVITLMLNSQNELDASAVKGVKLYYRYQTDSMDNKVKSYKEYEFKAPDDKVKPGAKIIKYENLSIDVLFSKTMEADNSVNWKIKREDDSFVAKGTLNSWHCNNRIVTISHPALHSNYTGNYVLYIDTCKDSSVNHNETGVSRLVFKGKDLVNPRVLGYNQTYDEYLLYGNNRKLNIKFNEAMDVSELMNKSNYHIHNANNTFDKTLADIPNSRIDIISDDHIRINLGSYSMKEAPNTYKYIRLPSNNNGSLHDKSGNPLTSFTLDPYVAQTPVLVPDGVELHRKIPAPLNKRRNPYYLKFVFNEPVRPEVLDRVVYGPKPHFVPLIPFGNLQEFNSVQTYSLPVGLKPDYDKIGFGLYDFNIYLGAFVTKGSVYNSHIHIKSADIIDKVKPVVVRDPYFSEDRYYIDFDKRIRLIKASHIKHNGKIVSGGANVSMGYDAVVEVGKNGGFTIEDDGKEFEIMLDVEDYKGNSSGKIVKKVIYHHAAN